MPKKKAPLRAKATSITDETSSPQSTGNNVRQMRRARKWTQWQLAQISRLSERTIQRIENGHRMGITAELALASAFEVEINSLYASALPGKNGEPKPDAPKTFQFLKRLVTGAAFLDVIESWQVDFDAHELGDEQHQAVEDFFQHMHVWGVMWREVEPSERVKACQVFQTKLDELDACGVYVFGERSCEPDADGTDRQMGKLVFKRADDPQIIQPRLLRPLGKAMCLISVPVDR